VLPRQDTENPCHDVPLPRSQDRLFDLLVEIVDVEVAENVGVQWELRGAVARRDQGHALGLFPPFQLEYLDAERMLPVLVRNAV
jgi:hypothetical protein